MVRGWMHSGDLNGSNVLRRSGQIRIAVDGRSVGAIEGQYIPLDYPDMPWRAAPAIGMSGDGTFYDLDSSWLC